MEQYINEGVPTEEVRTTEVQVSLPRAYAYAMVAAASVPVVEEREELEGATGTTEGGASKMGHHPFLVGSVVLLGVAVQGFL